jgi:hypothetical protein
MVHIAGGIPHIATERAAVRLSEPSGPAGAAQGPGEASRPRTPRRPALVANSVAALDRPDSVLDCWPERVDVSGHRGEPGLIRGVSAATDHRLVGGHHLDRGRPLVRVHPDHDPLCLLLHAPSPKLDPVLVIESGGQRYFELGRPLLSLFRLSGARPAHAM